KWKILPSWLSWFTVLLGLVAMLVILFIPEYYEHYKPLFHVKAAWLMIMGIVIIKSGINQDS
ncbi:MAG TPA: hypothetical protein DCM04_04675, partial [Saprospirales bacterium]|nr:hypothetical protein [Saprospirales bacterium]